MNSPGPVQSPALRLLGPLSTRDADSGTVLPRKARVLLAHLILSQRPVRRAVYLAMLWPAAPEERARGSLRVTLHQLRQALGADAVRADRQVVSEGVMPPTDLHLMLAAVRRGDDATVVACYQGPLLGELTLDDTVDGEVWLDAERGRLARLFEAAARRLLRQPESLAMPPSAARALAERLRESDPTQLANWAPLLTTLARHGTPDELAAERAALEARAAHNELDDVAGVDALLRALARVARSPDLERSMHQAPPVATRCFTQRDAAQAALSRLWQTVARGGRESLLLTGQAGIGKSWLLAAFREQLRPSAVPVVAVRATRPTRDMPLALLREVVWQVADYPGARQVAEHHTRWLARVDDALAAQLLLPGERDMPMVPTSPIAALTRAVSALLRQVASETPMVLMLDDLHWGDVLSLRILRRATRAVSHAPLLVVASARVVPGAAWQRWARWHLLPLNRADATALVHELAPAAPPPLVRVVVDRAGGVPLRLRHAVWLAEESAGDGLHASPEVPAVLHDESTWQIGPVAARVRAITRTDPVTGALLALLALWEAPLTAAELADGCAAPPPATGNGSGPMRPVTPEEVGRRLQRLRDLVTAERGDRWALTHDRVSDAVRRVLPPVVLHDAGLALARHFAQRAESHRDRHQVWTRPAFVDPAGARPSEWR